MLSKYDVVVKITTSHCLPVYDKAVKTDIKRTVVIAGIEAEDKSDAESYAKYLVGGDGSINPDNDEEIFIEETEYLGTEFLDEESIEMVEVVAVEIEDVTCTQDNSNENLRNCYADYAYESRLEERLLKKGGVA